ncbi:hypothetical protein [Desulfobacter latus]|uniref:Polysaccharide deacetylase n=1 Tax=Desulfobacter latus TaxID=2292 RepID=A0A850TAZ3_9BACT|nr:hypothetical protein [Desulfobacter latus]NWH05778.1 hypothetical protein [Desulfobacter latus]
MDFTLDVYRQLILTLLAQGFAFQSFAGFMQNPANRAIILRHDIDKLPANALKMAQLEHDLGVKGSYYFRVVPGVWNPGVMEKITALGHELGYHYEDMAIAKGDLSKAMAHFESQLAQFRNIYPVTTICMHGSPLSRHDNRALWQTYDYRDFGIIGEPYFDVDFTKVFYITDTGRKWNHVGASIRDRVDSGFDIPVNSTAHLAELAAQGKLPDQMMITVHPQRWHDRAGPWVKELVWQNVKNGVKRVGVRFGVLAG